MLEHAGRDQVGFFVFRHALQPAILGEVLRDQAIGAKCGGAAGRQARVRAAVSLRNSHSGAYSTSRLTLSLCSLVYSAGDRGAPRPAHEIDLGDVALLQDVIDGSAEIVRRDLGRDDRLVRRPAAGSFPAAGSSGHSRARQRGRRRSRAARTDPSSTRPRSADRRRSRPDRSRHARRAGCWSGRELLRAGRMLVADEEVDAGIAGGNRVVLGLKLRVFRPSGDGARREQTQAGEAGSKAAQSPEAIVSVHLKISLKPAVLMRRRQRACRGEEAQTSRAPGLLAERPSLHAYATLTQPLCWPCPRRGWSAFCRSLLLPSASAQRVLRRPCARSGLPMRSACRSG